MEPFHSALPLRISFTFASPDPRTTIQAINMPYTTSTTAGESSFISRRNTPHTIQNCSLYVGRPLSREEAVAKMERSPQFLEAAHDFGPQQDIVQNAVQLDYGIRLRNCLAAAGMGQ